MPVLDSRQVAVALDMAGCPNRCRHCWLGNMPNERVEENTDYFTRRRGAFRDNLIGTGRLLEEGISPRWQFFLTKKAVPELMEFVILMLTSPCFDDTM